MADISRWINLLPNYYRSLLIHEYFCANAIKIDLANRTDWLATWLKPTFTPFGYAPVRSILIMVGLVSFLGVNFVVILPIFSNEILHGDANTLGLLMAASGVGSLIAAVQLSLRREVRGLGRLVAIAPIIYGLCMIAFAISRSIWLSALLLAVIGFGSLLQSASSNTIIQTLVQDEMPR